MQSNGSQRQLQPREYLADVSRWINSIIVGNAENKDRFCKHISQIMQEAEKYEQYLRDEWEKAKEAGLTQHGDKKGEKEWTWWTAYANGCWSGAGIYFAGENESIQFYIKGKPKPDPLSYLHSMILGSVGQQYEGLEELDYQFILLAIIHDAQNWVAGRERIYFDPRKGGRLSDSVCRAVWHRLESYQAPYGFKDVRATIETAMLEVTASLQEQQPIEKEPFGFARGKRLEHKTHFIFRKKGCIWEITYEGQETTVKDTKGVRYIHYLVQNSNEAKDCFDIEKACSDTLNRDVKSVSESEALEAGLHTEQVNLERLDDFEPKVIIEAKRKLETDMENTDDPSKKMELKDQIQTIEKYLSHNVNIHGRRRPEGELEKARKRVSIAINTAKKNIAGNNEHIGQHFSAIKAEGTKFIYKTDRDIPWVLE